MPVSWALCLRAQPCNLLGPESQRLCAGPEAASKLMYLSCATLLVVPPTLVPVSRLCSNA